MYKGRTVENKVRRIVNCYFIWGPAAADDP